MKKLLARLLCSLSALLLLCALISCENGTPEKDGGATTVATEESTAVDTAHDKAEPSDLPDGTIPNLPEDGYTKLY